MREANVDDVFIWQQKVRSETDGLVLASYRYHQTEAKKSRKKSAEERVRGLIESNRTSTVPSFIVLLILAFTNVCVTSSFPAGQFFVVFVSVYVISVPGE